MQTKPKRKSQKQARSTSPDAIDGARRAIGERSIKRRCHSRDKRVNIDAEFIDLTTSKDSEIVSESSVASKKFPEPPASPKVSLHNHDDIATVAKEQYDSRLDSGKMAENGPENEPKMSRPLTPRHSSGRKPASSRLFKPQEMSEGNVPYIDLVDSDLDESIRSSPLWRKSGGSNRVSEATEPDLDTLGSKSRQIPTPVVQEIGTARTELSPFQNDNHILTKAHKIKKFPSPAITTAKSTGKQSPSKAESKAQVKPFKTQENKDSTVENKDSLVIQPCIERRHPKSSDDKNAFLHSTAREQGNDLEPHQEWQRNSSVAGDFDGASDQKDESFLPWSLQLPQFRQMWEAQRAERRAARDKQFAVKAIPQIVPGILKNGSSSENGTPNKRKRAHFAEDPVEAEASAPKTKKQKNKKKSPKQDLRSEHKDEKLSASQNQVLPASVPKVKASTIETYPGPPSRMTTQVRRATPFRAAPEPLVPIPERSRILSRSSRKRELVDTARDAALTPTKIQANSTTNKTVLKPSNPSPKGHESPKVAISATLLDRGNAPTAPILIDGDSDAHLSTNSTSADKVPGTTEWTKEAKPDSSRHSLKSATIPSERSQERRHGKELVKCEEFDDETRGNLSFRPVLTPLSPQRNISGDCQKPQPSRLNEPTHESGVLGGARLKSAKTAQGSPLRKTGTLTPPPSCEDSTGRSLKKEGAFVKPSGTDEKERKASEAGPWEEKSLLSRRDRLSMTPPLGQTYDLGPLDSVSSKKLKARKERRKAKSQRRAQNLRERKTPEQMDETRLCQKEKDHRTSSPKMKRKEGGSSGVVDASPTEITSAATNYIAAATPISTSGPPSPPLLIPPLSHAETITLSQDALVFSAYLQEVLELGPRIFQVLGKVPDQDVEQLGRIIGIDLAYMKKMVKHAASEAQQKVREKASKDFEKLGEWVIEKRQNNGEDGEAGSRL